MVQDRRGRFVDDLALDDFVLFEDDVQQTPTFFEASRIPLDLVLAVDFSASMTPAMGALQFAARHFIGELPEPAVLGLVAFNDRTYILARQERNRAVLLQAVDALPAPFGGTALLDALSSSLDLHGDEQAPRVVVLFSDGADRDSFSAVEAVEQRIRASRATVYVVTMGRGRDIQRVRELLGRLTRVSGGRSFSIERIDQLDQVLVHIRDRLQNRYFLAYESSNHARTARGVESKCERRTGGTWSRRVKGMCLARSADRPQQSTGLRLALALPHTPPTQNVARLDVSMEWRPNRAPSTARARPRSR